MTRKDYILIAAAIQSAMIQGYSGAEWARQCVAHNIALALANDNPRFDRERFLKACGVQS